MIRSHREDCRIPTWCISSKHFRQSLTSSSSLLECTNSLQDAGQPPFTKLMRKCLPPLSRKDFLSISDASVQHLSHAALNLCRLGSHRQYLSVHLCTLRIRSIAFPLYSLRGVGVEAKEVMSDSRFLRLEEELVLRPRGFLFGVMVDAGNLVGLYLALNLFHFFFLCF